MKSELEVEPEPNLDPTEMVQTVRRCTTFKLIPDASSTSTHSPLGTHPLKSISNGVHALRRLSIEALAALLTHLGGHILPRESIH